MNKKRSLALGILLGVAVVVSLGIVYIDNVKHYWITEAPYVRLYANTNYVLGVHTNNGAIGINITNDGTASTINVVGKPRAAVTSGNGLSGATVGRVLVTSGNGGTSSDPTTASGGNAGSLNLAGGVGGLSTAATTNSTGGSGAAVNILGGAGGSASSVATNAATGGNGGGISITGGTPSAPNAAATNTVGGNGGPISAVASSGASPSAGWARKGGDGGSLTLTAGNGGASVRTNAGVPGAIALVAGNAGAATTSPAFPQPGADISLTAGDGNTGDTNSNGGHIFLVGGSPGSGASPGNTYIGRVAGGTGRGGLVIGISNSAVLTNVMFVRTNLDFPSTLAQTDSDIPVLAVTGMTNAIVNVGPPTPAILTGSGWSGFCSNGTVFVRFSVYGLVAKDPGVGDFEVEIKAYR